MSARFGFTTEAFLSLLDHDPDVSLRPVVVARDVFKLKTGKQRVVVLGEKVFEVGQGFGVGGIGCAQNSQAFTEFFLLPRPTTRLAGFHDCRPQVSVQLFEFVVPDPDGWEFLVASTVTV